MYTVCSWALLLELLKASQHNHSSISFYLNLFTILIHDRVTAHRSMTQWTSAQTPLSAEPYNNNNQVSYSFAYTTPHQEANHLVVLVGSVCIWMFSMNPTRSHELIVSPAPAPAPQTKSCKTCEKKR